jgi:hypothetical protein
LARPIKVGLDYFSLDVSLDDNVELMEAECGLAGFAILIKLWQKIYSEGYYIEWEEDNAVLFSRKINSEITLVNSVVISCLSRKIFSKELYDKYKILTSKAIQKRYLIACKQVKRSNVTFIKDYLLVNSELTQVITELTTVNSEEISKNSEFSTQKKRKERKRNERKGKENNDELSPSEKSIELCKYFETLKPGQSIAAHIPQLNIFLTDYDFEWCKEAMQKTILNTGKFVPNYMGSILQDWKANGKPEPKKAENKKDTFNNYKQRDYDFKDLENKLTTDVSEADIEESKKLMEQIKNKSINEGDNH